MFGKKLFTKAAAVEVFIPMSTRAISNTQNAKLLGVREAAAYIGVSVWTLRRNAGISIPYIQYGDGTSPMKFLVSDLDAYIDKHRVRP